MDRYNIINSYSKSEFSDFLEFDNSGEVLNLFNEEGIQIIKNSSLKNDRINYILTFSPYKNELFKNSSFLDMFLNCDISYFYASLSNLNDEIYDIIFERSIKLNLPFTAKLFSYFNEEYKLSKIEKWNYSKDLLYEIFKTDSKVSVLKKIIDNYDIDLSSHNINLRTLFSTAKESVLKSQSKRNMENTIIDSLDIPPTMITKELAEKLWNNYDIFEIRAIINDAQYCTDISKLNNYIKNKEEYIIRNHNENTLFSPFQEIYNCFKQFKLEELKCEQTQLSDEYYIYRKQYISLLNNLDKSDNLDYYDTLNKIFEEQDLESVYNYLRELSDRYLSNYIIDYHFEENYHNIMIDVRELLNFYYNGYIQIQLERIDLYYKISNIDYLSYYEKIELHELLKNFNMMEVFYDDMSFARHIVAQEIKEYSLSKETIKQYKDEKLSKEYGVDVYNFDGESFFGIVKSGSRMADTLPAGHSYSLIGDGGIAVFGDQKNSNTFLYDSDDMNPEQLIHAFPYDSYTYYHPFEHSTEASTRVNILAMPDELVNTSYYSYNELLILEQGKNQTDIDKYIPKLKRIALYCLDEIRQQDLEVAKRQGIGIMLINSKKYERKNNSNLYPYHSSVDSFDNNYFNGFYEQEKFEARR